MSASSIPNIASNSRVLTPIQSETYDVPQHINPPQSTHVANMAMDSSTGYDVTALSTSNTWPTDGPMSTAGAVMGGSGSIDGTPDGTDLFEEFDAMLERQDSTHQQQFMQNLGFGPELDLLEFFGKDYLPSDPLLAYLNPPLYSLNGPSNVSDMLPD